MKLLTFLAALILSFPSSLVSWQATSSPPANSIQAVTLLTQSSGALTGGALPSDVTLSGTARRIAGSDDETGTVVLRARATGESRMDLTLSGGNRSEIRSADATGSPVGAWSGSDGVQHSISNHNLLTDSSWFFPALTMNRLLNTKGVVATYVGQETLNSQSVLHVSVSKPPSNTSGQAATLLQHLSQMDLFLDPATYLPVALSFNIHPDNNAGLDIPVLIQFSDYRNISGVQIAFHVQQFINNSLALDLQIQLSVLNSGISANWFSL